MKILFTCTDKPTIVYGSFHRANLNEKFEYSECISKAKTYTSHISSILFRLSLKMLGKNFYFVSYMNHFLVIFIRFFTKKLNAMQEAFISNEDILFLKDIKIQALVQKVANNALMSYDVKHSNTRIKNILKDKIFSKLVSKLS